MRFVGGADVITPAMDRLVRVPTQPGCRTFPSFSAILAPLRVHGAQFAWTILSLDGFVTPPGRDIDQPALLERIEQSTHGLELSFDELIAFAESTVQVSDGMFLGCRQPRPFPDTRADDETILRSADVMLSAFDSTFWIVGGPVPLIEDVKAAFVTQPEKPGQPLRT